MEGSLWEEKMETFMSLFSRSIFFFFLFFSDHCLFWWQQTTNYKKGRRRVVHKKVQEGLPYPNCNFFTAAHFFHSHWRYPSFFPSLKYISNWKGKKSTLSFKEKEKERSVLLYCRNSDLGIIRTFVVWNFGSVSIWFAVPI